MNPVHIILGGRIKASRQIIRIEDSGNHDAAV